MTDRFHPNPRCARIGDPGFHPNPTFAGFVAILIWSSAGGCRARIPKPEPPPFEPGHEIVACDERFDVGTPVVLWSDPIGFNAYSERCRWSDQALPTEPASRPDAHPSPLRYGERPRKPATIRELREIVHQVVLHYDAVGTSERCFRSLHDNRGLSVHFMLDLDGTVYQTLDLRERASHAKDANDESVGIEIANVGAYSTPKLLQAWYGRDDSGEVRNLFPADARPGSQRRKDVTPRPARQDLIRGAVHGTKLVQYDFTDEQYEALGHLLAGLARVFPRIRLEAPRDRRGRIPDGVLPDRAAERFEGLIGHYHLDERKYDPGPAFDWDRVLLDSRRVLAAERERR